MSIPTSPRLSAILAGRTFQMVARATITRAGKILATDLPIDVGREEFDVSVRVPERLTMQIPRRVDGDDWADDINSSPVAPFGQRVHVKLGIDTGPDGYEWINRGEFLLHDADLTGPTVTINAVGLLALIEEARLLSPYNPVGTMKQAIRRLVEPALTVVFSPDLVDITVTGNLVFEDDRLAALQQCFRNWPARGQIHPDGYLYVCPADEYGTDPTGVGLVLQRHHMLTQPHLTPNVRNVSTSATRDGIYNAVVVRGTAPDGGQISAVQYDRRGPAAYGGPFNPLPVPEFYQSNNIRSMPQAQVVAGFRLREIQAPFDRSWQLTCVPQPKILGNDYLNYLPTLDENDEASVLVDRLVLPYTPRSGAMDLGIREIESL